MIKENQVEKPLDDARLNPAIPPSLENSTLHHGEGKARSVMEDVCLLIVVSAESRRDETDE